MAKTIFEQMGGTYTIQGDYYLPDLTLPARRKNAPVAVWGQRSPVVLKATPQNPLLQSAHFRQAPLHLADVEEEAQTLFFRLVKEYAKRGERDRATKSRQPYGVGKEDEQHPRACQRKL